MSGADELGISWAGDSAWNDLAAAGWNELALAQSKPSLLGSAWFRHWQRHLAPSRPVRIACLPQREGGPLGAAIPLIRRRDRGLATMYYESLGEPLARRAEDARRLGWALGLARVGQISLTNMAAGDARCQALRSGALEAGAHVDVRPAAPEYVIQLCGTGYEDFEHAALTSNARRQIRKLRRRAERDHGLVARPLRQPGPDEYLSELRSFFAIEEAGWKGRAQTAIASDRARRGFYEAICGEMAQAGRLRYSTLHLDGETAAFDFGVVEDDGCLYSFKTSYLERFSEYAPGNLLRASIIAAAYEEGLGANSLGSGANRSKERFATTLRPAETLTIFPRRTSGVARRVALHGARGAKRVQDQVSARVPGR